jgi:peptidoglycan/LPS O-acetylase OafA/YrhL
MVADTTRRPTTPDAPPRASVEPGSRARPRVEVIDALRGVAALVVLLQHSAELLWVGYARWSVETFRPGEWGVFTFFMVSGFVIPLSTERDRDPVSFWIGRAFRLFPLYWAVLVAAVIVGRLGWYPMPAEVVEAPAAQLLANTTMVQSFLGATDVIGSAWSLAYEVVFYLFITVLLVTGSRSGSVRATLLVLAAASTLGVLLPPMYLVDGQPGGSILLTGGGLVVAALVVAVPRMEGRQARVIGSAAVVAVALLTVNQPLDLWFSLLLFATIGCGWVYHEAHLGRIQPWVPVAVSAATVLLAVYHLQRWVEPHQGAWGARVTWGADAWTLAAAHLAFGLVHLIRRWGFPPPLRWLGQISYSLYLVHGLVINSFRPFDGHPVATFTCWVVLSLAISTVTYRWIEVPAQSIGRLLRQRRRARAAEASVAA